MRALFALFVLAGCGALPPAPAQFTPVLVEQPSPTAQPARASTPPPSIASKAPRACVSFPAGNRPKLLHSLWTGFSCGVCTANPDCRARDEEGRKPIWDAMLATHEERVFRLAGGSFGEPGTNRERGPAWEVYLVFASAPPNNVRDTWTVDADGPKVFVRSYPVNFGAFVVDAMIFQDEMPYGGTKELTMTSCDGAILFHDQIDFIPRYEM